MSDDRREKLLDLLLKKAVYGLDEAEQRELDAMDRDTAAELHSLEMTVAAINLAETAIDEPLPAHLFARIVDDFEKNVGETDAANSWQPVRYDQINVAVERSGSPWFGWLGWAVAAAACIVLAVNIWNTRTPSNEQAKIQPTPEVARVLTPAEMRDEMIRSTAGMIKANWGPGTMKDLKQVEGDVVWSDEKQIGYMRFRGLPVNDKAKETYQLWIFDKTQDKATPIDGGTFDVASNGEVIIPINAKLKAKGPEMFAITIEKPGGVVVSKREKIAALAKVENQSS